MRKGKGYERLSGRQLSIAGVESKLLLGTKMVHYFIVQ